MGLTFETVSRQQLRPSLEVPGQIIADERRAVNLSPKVDGWIRHLNVSVVGQPVRKGQVLFDLYSPDLQQRQRDYLDILTRRDVLLANAGSMSSTLGNSAPDAMLASVARERYRIRSQLSAADVPDAVLDDLEKTRHIHDIVPVLAEHDGVVTNIGAREGAFVMPTQNVVSYADLSVVWAELSLEPDQLIGLRRGEAVKVRSSIDPDLTVTARIDSSLAIVDPATRIARLRVPLPPTRWGFPPGTGVSARIELPSHPALTVDSDAVIYTGHGDFVIAPGDEPGTFQQIPVHTGASSGSRVEILGLADGQRIVTNGQFLLSAEASLQSIRRDATQTHD
jgi:Cu(I)/Ag(I) efflux system membrane fusion protein